MMLGKMVMFGIYVKFFGVYKYIYIYFFFLKHIYIYIRIFIFLPRDPSFGIFDPQNWKVN